MKAILVQTIRRFVRVAPLALAMGAGLLGSTAAQAQYRHGWYGPRVGIYVGPGYYYPPYYPPAAPYYYPPPVIVQSQPPVYIERPAEGAPAAPQAQVQPQASPYYFCAASNAYYPYVKECPGGWQQVAPQPPGR